ncbi:hypothetical protein UVIVOLLU_CDS0076 [Salmonella phage PHA46_2]
MRPNLFFFALNLTSFIFLLLSFHESNLHHRCIHVNIYYYC